jgi:hypothetical protein
MKEAGMASTTAADGKGCEFGHVTRDRLSMTWKVFGLFLSALLLVAGAGFVATRGLRSEVDVYMSKNEATLKGHMAENQLDHDALIQSRETLRNIEESVKRIEADVKDIKRELP